MVSFHQNEAGLSGATIRQCHETFPHIATCQLCSPFCASDTERVTRSASQAQPYIRHQWKCRACESCQRGAACNARSISSDHSKTHMLCTFIDVSLHICLHEITIEAGPWEYQILSPTWCNTVDLCRKRTQRS